MFRKVYLFFYCILLSSLGIGQTADLPKRAKETLTKAQKAWAERNLGEAEIQYTKLNKDYPDLFEPNMRLAQISDLNKLPADAFRYYSRAVAIQPDSPESASAYYWLGNKVFKEEKYDSSLVYFEKLLPLTKTGTSIQRNTLKLITSAKFAVEQLEKPMAIEKKPLSEEVNFLNAQFFPALTGDKEQLFFTGIQSPNGEDIFISQRSGEKWTKPENLSPVINSANNEGTCTISANGRILVFTACGRPDSFGGCDLYVSYKNGDKWTTPRNLGNKINSRSWESQPSLSADGRTLYFASDRSGGLGKSDIWKSELSSDNQWSLPVNLGKKVNTPDDENAPFIHANGETLFFSSTGWPGFGGFDIFRTQLDDPTVEKPINLGYPINNGADQVGLFITSDGQEAYYTDDRQDKANGRSLLYTFEVPQELRTTFLASSSVKGKITDGKTGQPLEALIRLYDLEEQTQLSEFTSQPESGEFLAMVNQGKQYAFYIEKKGYLFKSLTFELTSADTSLHLTVKLEPVEKDRIEVLQNIFFKTASFELDDKSKVELQKLVAFLKENQKISIEISGHTDDVGHEKDNQELSLKRAQAVLNFLTNSGIDPARLAAKGYGESKPRVPNDTDENKAANRRIEWQIR